MDPKRARHQAVVSPKHHRRPSLGKHLNHVKDLEIRVRSTSKTKFLRTSVKLTMAI